ncbi:MAG: pilus assembly protein TadG-related protein [Rhodomicrobium sp.]
MGISTLKLMVDFNGMVVRIAVSPRKLMSSRRGSVAIQMGILMTVLIGMAALGTEIPLVIYKHRQMQNVADAAALGGAVALIRGYPAPAATEAQGIAAALGFVNAANGVTVTVNNPPKSGSYTSNSGAVEAIVSQPQTLIMAGLFGTSLFNVSARAVALGGSNGNFCVLATDTAAETSVTISNGAAVTMNGCGLAVNATGAAALSVTGGSSLDTQAVSAAGQVSVGGGAVINATNGVNQNQPVTADPYANVPMPASSGCDYTSFTVGGGGSHQISPGRYCNGVSIGGDASVSMAPGIYYIKSGTFTVGGGAKVTGSGVTIVLTQNIGGYATVTIGNGASVTLSAPASGSLAGILFFADRNSPNSSVNNFIGGASETFTGALYLPTQQVVFSNGAGASACTQLIAWQIQFSGGSSSQFSSNCSNSGVSPIGGGSASLLVE